MSDQLQQAISAARQGQTSAALELLRQLVSREPNNSEAWLWLGGVSADPSERLVALTRVLSLTPGDQRAQQGLEALRRKHPELFQPPAPPPAPADDDLFSRPDFFDTVALSTTVDAPAPSASSAQLSAPQPAAIASPAPTPAAPQPAPEPIGLQPWPSADEQPAPAQPAWPSPPSLAIPALAHDAPTVAQPTVGTLPSEQPLAPDSAYATVPLIASPAEEPASSLPLPTPAAPAQRSILATAARMLLAALWLVGTAALLLPSVSLLRLARQMTINGDSVSPTLLQQILVITGDSPVESVRVAGFVLLALSLLAALMALGSVLRWRVVLFASLLAGFGLAAVGIVVAVLTFSGNDLLSFQQFLGFNPQIASIGLAILLAWPLLTAFVAWPDFFRPRTQP